MRLAVAALLLTLCGAAFAKDPDCAGINRWPAVQVFLELKSSGAIAPDQLDGAKTTVRLINSSRVGKDQYRQVHLVRFHKKDGAVVEAIIVNEVSPWECSADEADIYIVARKVTGYSDETGKPVPYDPGPAGKPAKR